MEKKQKIGLVADEGGDLPKNLIEKYEISIVPFKVDFGEMKNLKGNIYEKIKKAEKRSLKPFIKTSQPSVGDFLKVFKEKLEKFEEIICITITSKHSGTFNSAVQARNFLKENLKNKVHIVDSLNGSCGEGLIVLKAASLIKKGLNLKEILENLKKSISKTNLIAILKDPKWLETSGRIPHILAEVLRKFQKIGIRPLIGVKRGKVKFVGVKKGKEIATCLFKEFESKLSKFKKEKIKVAITHADNLKEALKLKKMIEKIKNCEIVFINLISEVLGGLAGPGTVALAWQYD